MQIDKQLCEDLLAQAAVNPRRRMHFDLRTTPEDGSQRMLNAIWPDSVIPVHKHDDTAETVFIFMGEAVEVFFDDNGNETHRVRLCAAEGSFGVQVPVGAWHALMAITPCVIFEAKDGSYRPLA